jgi:tetratricopeptide (TPR) repeat protein
MFVSGFRFSLVLCLALTATFFLASSPAFSQMQTSPQSTALTKDQLDAKDALDQGVAAFKNGQFDEAARLFERARQLDPSLVNAPLYLATAYASEYIPGAPSEENQQKGKLAISTYKEVLQIDPNNLAGIDGLASILYQMAGQPFSVDLFNESKTYHQRHIDLRPEDPQPYYSIGVIDWALAYRANTELRAPFKQPENEKASKNSDDQSEEEKGLKDTDPLPEVAREEYAQKYGAMVDEGIASLKRAMELKPNYDDAMVYLNLLYRRKADMVSSPTEREEFTKLADDLLDHVKEIKQKRAEQVPESEKQ